MMRWLPLGVALALLVGCGAPVEPERVGSNSDAIVNGTPDSGDPAVVYLDMGCSGTLITPLIVLSACHCFEQVSSPPDVFFGSDINGGGDWISTVHYETYPGQCSGDGDFAIMTLQQPGPTQPIPVNDRDLGQYVGDTVRVIGFGVTSENGQDAGIKRKGTSILQQVDQGIMLCDPSSPSGTCYGDSGGPNLMTFEGVEYLVGATSYGTEACGSGLDASARTDSHYDWITQYIATHDPDACGADSVCVPGCTPADPDCACGPDGMCTPNCGDPDCDGCSQDGVCHQDCATMDPDCCAANGICHEVCKADDPDCAGLGGPSSGSGPGGPNPGLSPRTTDETEEEGGCTLSTGSSHTNWTWLLAALLALRIRRRRARSS